MARGWKALTLRQVSDQSGGKGCALHGGLCELLTLSGSRMGKNAVMHNPAGCR
jgi:hypothetical protein